MTLPQIISRNQIQKTNKRTKLSNDTSGYPITDYTCPSNKIAVIKGTCVCSDTGAAATVDLNAAGVSIAEWQASGGGTDPNVPQDLVEGFVFHFEINLSAAETLTRSQSSGTNANTTINILIEEFKI